MNVKGLGLDIIEIYRIEEAIDRWGKKFLARIFSQDEISYCTTKSDAASCFAARFAAKEAFFKAVSPPKGISIPFRSIKIINDKNGRPEIIYAKEIGGLLESMKVDHINLSISHSRLSATAVIILT